MKLFAKASSALGLLLTVLPSVVVFQGGIDLDTAKFLMLLGTAIWFGSAPVWMNRPAAGNKQ